MLASNRRSSGVIVASVATSVSLSPTTRENPVSEDKSLDCRYLYKVPFTSVPFSERGINGQVKVTRFARYRGIHARHLVTRESKLHLEFLAELPAGSDGVAEK